MGASRIEEACSPCLAAEQLNRQHRHDDQSELAVELKVARVGTESFNPAGGRALAERRE